MIVVLFDSRVLLAVNMHYVPFPAQHIPAAVRTSHCVEELIEALKRMQVNISARQLVRDAAAIVINRTESELASETPLVVPKAEEIQQHAFAESNAEQVDMLYDLDEDRAMEAKLMRNMRAKYMTALAYCMGRFLGINSAVLGLFDSTVNIFEPAPEVTGAFCAATLSMLGMPERSLPSLKKYLQDRLYEECDKLVRAARLEDVWYKELQKMCRGQGCAETCVDRCAELVAEACSFSTAAALFRLRDGQGAAEAEELAALNTVVEEAQDDYVTAGVQNLEMLIWPSREYTFDCIRSLMIGNKKADDGITGWENRCELALICKNDHISSECVRGLIEMEHLRAYLVSKEKDLELVALSKVMKNHKAASSILRKLTPSFTDKLEKWLKSLTRFDKIRLAVICVGGGLIGSMWAFKQTGLHETMFGSAVMFIFDVVLLVVTFMIATFVGIWFVMKGHPYRDMVKGPNKEGVDFLRKVCDTAADENEKDNAYDALQSMLMGQEPNVEGKTFLRNRATKYIEKMPQATEAIDTMEFIFVLQQAGKSTLDMDGFDEELEWPSLHELWPPTRFKVMEAKNQVYAKIKSFVVVASVHPWMKKYAQHADDAAHLFQAVEVPLAMKPDNAEEFDALDKLFKGYRPDPAGLHRLQKMVDELVDLDKRGGKATTFQEALIQNHRTGNVKEIFNSLDKEGTGSLDMEDCESAAEMLADKMGFHVSQDEMDTAFMKMDLDASGEVSFAEFSAWWQSTALNKTQKRAKKLQQMESAGLLEGSPKPRELQAMMKVISNLLPTVSLRLRTFETLEDMCPDDETFDCLQECFNLCELKRLMLANSGARNAVVGLEAMCIVPKLLEGDAERGIPPNPRAKEILDKVKLGDKAALAALKHLKQREVRRWFGMMTGRQRRALFLAIFCVGYPILVLVGAINSDSILQLASIIELTMEEACTGNFSNCTNSSGSGSWDDLSIDDMFLDTDVSAAGQNSTRHVSPDEYANPSFYVLGLLPAAGTTFVTFFGQRIASLITLGTVFVASAGATIAAAMNDGSDEFTPRKLVGVGMGCYAGGVATKVATGNIKFAYGVQGGT
eukprot:COSAG05_NODE_773_length_7441_cov_3.657042_2_plen_1076_part_00